MKKRLPIVLMILTLILGVIGYCLTGMPFYNALVKSFTLLTISAAAEPSNLVVEIARWVGLAFALNVVYTIVETAVTVSAENITTRLRSRQPDAIAVHGDGIMAERLASNLPNKVIRSDRPASFNVSRQVLLFSNDEKAMKFYNEHSKELKGAKEVYISLDRITPLVARREGVFAFSMAGACAQLYWGKYPVNEAETIVIIGEGDFAEAILTEALLVNLFSIEGGVVYRVYGSWVTYRSLHSRLDEAMSLNSDVLEFVDQDWYYDLPDIALANRIILCYSAEKNLKIASDLRVAGINAIIHMRSDSEDCIDFLGLPSISVFGTTDQLCTSAIVLQQTQQDAGKVCAITYRLGTTGCDECVRQASLPADKIKNASTDASRSEIKDLRLKDVDYEICLNCPLFISDWRQMDEFTKASNYAVAAHDAHKQKLIEMEVQKVSSLSESNASSFDSLPLESRDYLQEIEHIRWCRYHYLNNWSYGPNGKNKAARTHHYLVPYSELPRAIKDLDGDAYHTLPYRRKRRAALNNPK